MRSTKQLPSYSRQNMYWLLLTDPSKDFYIHWSISVLLFFTLLRAKIANMYCNIDNAVVHVVFNYVHA